MGLLNPLRLFTSHFRKIPTAGSSCRLGVVPTTNYSPTRHGKPGEGGGEGGGDAHRSCSPTIDFRCQRAENNQKLFSDFSSDVMLPNSYCLTFNPAPWESYCPLLLTFDKVQKNPDLPHNERIFNKYLQPWFSRQRGKPSLRIFLERQWGKKGAKWRKCPPSAPSTICCSCKPENLMGWMSLEETAWWW